MNIGFIGAGKMAEAMIGALLKASYVSPDTVCASDTDAARRLHLSSTLGISLLENNADVVRHCGILFMAVKPQQLDAVLQEISPCVGEHHLVISIAAGKQIDRIESRIPLARVIRVMPNVASLVAEGMSVFTRGHKTLPADHKTITDILNCFGKSCELPETLFDAVTALSGSGPAFFAYFIECLVKGAEAEGVPRAAALLLAEQTMLGTARLLMEHPMAPQQLIDAVTSTRGTTAEGRAVLESSDVAAILQKTIQAATRRSRELRSV